MITQSFFLIRWQACRSSGSTDTPVSDHVWHTDYSNTSSTVSYGTGLRVSLLLYWVLFRLLRSNWVIRSSRFSLQRLEVDRFELTISYFAWKLLKRSLSSENFALMSLLKISRLRTISSSFDKFSNWVLVGTIVNDNKLEDNVWIRTKWRWLQNGAYASTVIR